MASQKKEQNSMRNFIYTISKSTVSRTYGGANETASIYELKDGEINYIGETKWCTRGYMGEAGEINRFLLNNNIITAEQSKDRQGTQTPYYCRDNGFYKISQI